METKTIARIGAAAFVGVVITMTALQMRAAPAGPTETEIVTVGEEGVDPLPAELRSFRQRAWRSSAHRCAARVAEPDGDE